MPRHSLQRFRCWFISLAIFAVLANALAPGISQAMVATAAAPGAWTEVCSASGSRWLRLDGAGQVLEESATRPDGAPASAHGTPACGYCLTHAGSFGLPAVESGPLWISTAPVSFVAPIAALPVAWSSPAWSWPALRGPPAA